MNIMARKISTRIPVPLKKRKHVARKRKLGKAPGTVTYLGTREGTSSRISVIEYSEDNMRRDEIEDVDILKKPVSAGTTQWINVVGLSDEQLMSRLGALSGLNSLVVEDIVNTEQRPKLDEYEDHIFGVFKMLYLSEERNLVKEHVAIVLMKDRVYLYQEVADDVFDGVRQRIEQKSGRIRSRGADYLFFALLDALIDNYFIVLEHMEDRMDQLEEEVYASPNQQTAAKIQQIRKEILNLRGWIAPVRELISRLIQPESDLITKDTRIFLRDILDHANEIHETLHIQREMAFSLMDMYMSSVSNRMNEVMKVLTIMASIFIPLTFIAGIYGMNFNPEASKWNMPELNWPFGYFGALGIMLAVAVSMLAYFRRKGWL